MAKENQMESMEVLNLGKKDFAQEIYETGMLMGLLPVHKRDQSLKEIRERLKKIN